MQLRSRSLILFVVSLLVVGATTLGEPARDAAAVPAIFTVTSTSDTGGFCDGGNNCASLRQAINSANLNGNSAERDIINFSLGAGPYVITIASSLPTILEPVHINGESVSGTVCGSPGRTIRLEVTGPGPGVNAFIVTSAVGPGVVISGVAVTNLGTAVFLGGGTGHEVRCSNFGVTAAGLAASLQSGVQISNSSSGMILGGDSVADRNIFAGANMAVASIGTDGNHVVQNNWFGMLPDGTTLATNSTAIYASNVNGFDILDNVLVHGTGGSMITFSGSTSNAVIQGNTIGYAADGTTPLGTGSGLIIDIFAVNPGQIATDHLIGGTGPGEKNRIRSNTPTAVIRITDAVDSTVHQVTIRGNDIAVSPGRGIALLRSGESGATPPNDPLDADSGSNQLQNFPVITAAVEDGTVTGTFNSSASATFDIDYYAGSSCTGPQDGERYLGTRSVTTDVNGDATINHTGLTGYVAGEGITATATDALGNTSEFSLCKVVTAAPVPKTVTSTNPPAVVSGSSDGAVSVIGTGFVDGDVVEVDGNEVETTYVSETELSFVLTGALRDVNPSDYSLTVVGATGSVDFIGPDAPRPPPPAPPPPPPPPPWRRLRM